MKRAGRRRPARPAPSRSVTELRARLHEVEATLRAIQTGGVDALVVTGRAGPRVYTLEGAEHAYRLLVESMNEGALMLTGDALILYANQRFARMVHRPLAQVTACSFRRFLSEADQEALRPLLNGRKKPGSTIQVFLRATGRQRIPVQISARRLARNGTDSATFCMVVTDVTETRRNESTLRRLSHSLLQAQETDRRRLAVALHDRASQSLGALLMRLHVLADNLPKRARSLRREVAGIGALVGETAEVVEDISRNLRPSVLEILGLVPALEAATAAFMKRTDLAVRFACERAPARLSAEIELVLYRILEEALRNVEKHAGAHNVRIELRQQRAVVELVIRDDGAGFGPGHRRAGSRRTGGMGLIGLRERAASVGGALRVTSTRGAGTEIEARIPVPRGADGLLDRVAAAPVWPTH